MTSNSSSVLPLGWGDRSNKMSERDIQLGGIAANKFGSNQIG